MERYKKRGLQHSPRFWVWVLIAIILYLAIGSSPEISTGLKIALIACIWAPLVIYLGYVFIGYVKEGFREGDPDTKRPAR
ncbi:hypothetical protein [Devriesea agamarum]|uniref:hypothetical protein n=1 Tax=Devriesea agamarum TaxID=472569 RepID=UPI00071C2217|nr:hypothetical protein [Devriesea agamarum]